MPSDPNRATETEAALTAQQSLADENDARVVRGHLSALGIDGIFDVHTHFMPKQVLDKVWAYFESAGPLTGSDWPIAYRHDETRRLEILRSYGVRRFSSMFYPHRLGMAEWLNEWGAQFAAATPDCLHSATFYPEPEAKQYVPAAIEAGTQVFKAHVQVGVYDPNDPLLDSVWGALQDSGTPVVIHSGHGPVAGVFTGPERMWQLLRRFPRLTLIVAHMGMPDYGEFLDMSERHERVYLDTTMVFTEFSENTNPFPASNLAQLKALGEKVLFGSDFPNLPYGYREAVEAVLRLDLGDEWARGVLHENATRLFSV